MSLVDAPSVEQARRLQRLSAALLAVAFVIYFVNVWRYSLQMWDDAFISFRFARNLAEGYGLCWNIGGERVEGFTNMLQVLLLAAGARLGMAPEWFALGIAVTSVVGTVLLLIGVLRRVFGFVHPVAAALLAIYLVDWTTTIHTTSGLETQLFIFLLCSAYACALSFVARPSMRNALLLTVSVFLSVMCRPEGVLFGGVLIFVLCLWAIIEIARHHCPVAPARMLLAAIGALLLLGSVYAVCKYRYFGYLLPNSLYVKSHDYDLHGATNVARFLVHAAKWLGPVLVLVALFTPRRRLLSILRSERAWILSLLTLAPAVAALGFYCLIVHEVGGAHRFSYPTYFYLLMAACGASTTAVLSMREPWRGRVTSGISVLCLVGMCVWAISSLRPLRQLSYSGFPQYHHDIADALRVTGLEHRATVICVAAGVIPYVSGFSQIDPVGLTDNYLSGRVTRSMAERDAYLWSRQADVYVGFEPPASASSRSVETDSNLRSSYVTEFLVGRAEDPIGDRFLLKDPALLYRRMVELRDRWVWVGETGWPGWKAFELRSFVYVRKASPHRATLVSALDRLVDAPPGAIDLNDGTGGP